jgi:hypothetical protein
MAAAGTATGGGAGTGSANNGTGSRLDRNRLRCRRLDRRRHGFEYDRRERRIEHDDEFGYRLDRLRERDRERTQHGKR